MARSILAWIGCVGLFLGLAAGCSDSSAGRAQPEAQVAEPKPAARSSSTPRRGGGTRPTARDLYDEQHKLNRRLPSRTLADLLNGETEQQPDAILPGIPDESPLDVAPVDDAAVEAAGIRAIRGRYLTLLTDVPSSPEVDELPQVFDLAVPQWCAYFGIDPARLNDWHVRGSLIKDRERFQRVGLLRADLPPFLNGFAHRRELWLYEHEQRTDYYRRHLLLHEGTHAVMLTLLSKAGPPWYMEGIAELLATHRWQDGQLTLRHFPADAREVPGWGRIALVQQALAEARPLSLQAVMDYDRQAHLQLEPYAWSWAAAALLDGHPRYQQRFRRLHQHLSQDDAGFNLAVRELFKSDWRELNDDWQVFVLGLEHGYDLAKTQLDYAPGGPLASSGMRIQVAADRGWQNTRLKLEGGKTYRLTASGRFQVAQTEKPWWSEANGVTIRYYQGRPLGVLLAAIRSDAADARASGAFIRPMVVGLGTEITPPQSGTLFLRVNDSAAELHDNQGLVTVEVQPPP